ncbi:MAG: hypothetical protein KGL39_37320 [Patescibacteria group bacterium]|nr:hypothetical protein [Patescibacteria group bacterium]
MTKELEVARWDEAVAQVREAMAGGAIETYIHVDGREVYRGPSPGALHWLNANRMAYAMPVNVRISHLFDTDKHPVSGVGSLKTAFPRFRDLRDAPPKLRELLPTESPDEIVRGLIEDHYPQLIPLFYPRVYETIHQYHSPKSMAYWLASVAAQAARFGLESSATAYRLMLPALQPMIEKKMPMFFVSPSLLKAIQLTDFAGDIDWTEMKLPYEHGILMLPRGGYSHPTDGEVSMIVWSRTYKDQDYLPPVLGVPVMRAANTAFAICALCPGKGIWYDSCLNAKFRPTLQLRNLFYRESSDAKFPHLSMTSPADQPLEEKDAEFLEGLGVIAFGTLLAMNARPELVERGKMLKRVQKGDKVREFWSPNIIGSKYKPKREVPSVKAGQFVYAATGQPKGTHASPRMHWRRGHFRQQPCGPQHKERKSLWIEPCLIAAVGA